MRIVKTVQNRVSAISSLRFGGGGRVSPLPPHRPCPTIASSDNLNGMGRNWHMAIVTCRLALAWSQRTSAQLRRHSQWSNAQAGKAEAAA